MRAMAFATLGTLLSLGVLVAPALPAAHAAQEPGRGTAESFIKLADVVVGDSLRVGAVHSESHATLDHAKADVPENRVFREFIGGLVESPAGRSTLPSPPWRVESGTSRPGEANQDTAPMNVAIPSASASPRSLGIAGIGGVSALPEAGEQGWLVDATLTPSRIRANFLRSSGGSIHAALNVGAVRLLDGLVDLTEIGPGEIRTETTPDENVASTRGLEIGEVRLLDVDALLEVSGLGGLDVLPALPLALIADRMHLRLATPDGDFTPFGTWAAAVDAVVSAQTAVARAAQGGLACATLSQATRTDLAAVYASAGRSSLDCAVGVLSADVARDLTAILDGAVSAMRGGLAGESLLSVHDFGGLTRASAQVPASGDAEGSALAWAQVGRIKVGSLDLGGFTTATADPVLDDLEAAIDQALSDITAGLGPEYADLVSVDVLPVAVAQPVISGGYATSQARVAIMLVRINPPGVAALSADAVLTGVTDGLVARPATTTAGPADLSGARAVSASRPAPTPLASPVDGLQPIAIVLGQLVSDAEHMRPGVSLQCEGVCDLPNVCHAGACSDPNGSATSADGPGAARGELPRTGGKAGGLTLFGGATLLVGGHLLRRTLRRTAPLSGRRAATLGHRS